MCLNDSESVGVTGLLAMGFALEGTGGGCDAYTYTCDDGAVVYVTNGDGNAPNATDHEWTAGVEQDEEWTDEEIVASPMLALAAIRGWVDAHSDVVCDACRSYGPNAKGCRCGGAK